MNFFTDSFDLPQNEQRRCFSLGMATCSPLMANPVGPVVCPGSPRLDLRFSGRGAVAGHLGPIGHDTVDDAVLDGFLGAHETVAVDVVGDPLARLPGGLGPDLGQAGAGT